jgi:hypothetical protein
MSRDGSILDDPTSSLLLHDPECVLRAQEWLVKYFICSVSVSGGEGETYGDQVDVDDLLEVLQLDVLELGSGTTDACVLCGRQRRNNARESIPTLKSRSNRPGALHQHFPSTGVSPHQTCRRPS